jgi:hypothetical protein
MGATLSTYSILQITRFVNLSQIEQLTTLQRTLMQPIKIDLTTDIQKQLKNATHTERRDIARRYIEDNLKGNYTATDNRIVIISNKTAKKYSNKPTDIKVMTVPYLAVLIEQSVLIEVVDSKPEKDRMDFDKFAYYRASFEIDGDIYVGRVVVGINTPNKSATLYDLVDLSLYK